MKYVLLGSILLLAVNASAQTVRPRTAAESTTANTIQTDVLGQHDFSASSSDLHGGMGNACTYCHIAHHGAKQGLWNQTLSANPPNYTASSQTRSTPLQTNVSETSSLCLSCHDGTVAVGQTIALGQFSMTGKANGGIGAAALQNSHPYSLQLPFKDVSHLIEGFAPATSTALNTARSTVRPLSMASVTGPYRLVDGNVECNTCHDVHNQFIDKNDPSFLVQDNTAGSLCLTCHTTAQRTVNGISNPLVGWDNSVHAKSLAQVATGSGLGNRTTVADYGCSACHVSHNAAGGALLRTSSYTGTANDPNAQNCLVCHDGSNHLVQPILNVMGDYEKVGSAHPFADAQNQHTSQESALLDRNRHTTCADCHQPHGSLETTSFGPAPGIRPSQTGVVGIGTDGMTKTPAVAQYENCLRCHGTSIGKQSLTALGYMPLRGLFSGDQLNVNLEFGVSAMSFHPVMRDATLAYPTTLRPFMIDNTGKPGTHVLGSRILCTDCHNSDSNREFGGTGPNGPHGSLYPHILERRYEMSKVNGGAWPTGGPGTLVMNLNLTPIFDPALKGPYDMCAKCHDLDKLMTIVAPGASTPVHLSHTNAGLSCSTCHSGHGVQSGTIGVTGAAMVTFDLNVVGKNNGVISYGANGTCTLTCHMVQHNSDGTILKLQ